MADLSRLAIRRKSPILAGLIGGVLLIVAAAFWVVFAPSLAGGSFSYVFTAGNSMEPVFHQGDLVFLRSTAKYEVGDMIAFRDPLQGLILHRIRTTDADGKFITRGDNRQSDDTFHSTPADVVGEVVGQVPGVGRVLGALQSPRNTILLTFATVALGAAGASRKVNVRRLRWQRPTFAGIAMRDPSATVAPRRWAAPLVIGSPGGNALSNIFALMLAAGVLIGLVVVMHGATSVRPLPLIFETRGALGYTAKGAPGVYDTPLATTGDPVFTALADRVDFTFNYDVEGAMPMALISDVTGTVRLDAEISGANGWKRTLSVVPQTPLSGPNTKTIGSLSLRDVREMIRQMETAAGVTFAQYRINLKQTVVGSARVSGQGVNMDYRKDVVFAFDQYQFAVNQPEELKQQQGGTVSTTIREPWSVKVPLLPFSISYAWMRFASLSFVLVSIGGLVTMSVATRMTERAGEAAMIEARYSDLLVRTDAAAIDFGGQLVGVAEFEELARMARRTQGSILHCKLAVGDQYLLVEPGITYLYAVAPVRKPVTA